MTWSVTFRRRCLLGTKLHTTKCSDHDLIEAFRASLFGGSRLNFLRNIRLAGVNSHADYTTKVAQGDRRRITIDLALVWLIPIAQALINETWLYTPLGYLDPWYYLGFGLNYTDPTFENQNYKIARLPWLLLQFIVRSLVDAVVASWILQIGTLTLASTSLYLLFARTLGRSAAFFGAAFFAAYTFGHASGGADYHNALGGLYSL
ncbi:hypothetical protein [Microvirga brassicacearum]|uniref:Glycosyltransferase RgtA/B/C/D-like domain-containing protein n=1 Tax=Microvirga brassicacearum TaxID=2580413 RepID=A0A5N3PJ06_9HYPH|nr:hypothetical protein [Microvirga brassicacearum]KAB0269704.1 hypothetical protein FEZ63_00055 [Microvirga brassicacearum]